MPRAKKKAEPKTQAKPPAPSEKLLGGWMPAGWWGEKVPKTRIPKNAPETVPVPDIRSAIPVTGITTELITIVQRRVSWLRAIVNDNLNSKRPRFIPFSLETNRPIPGEEYFLIICQMLYRARQVKMHLGEEETGEDVVQWLVNSWAEAPLTREELDYIVEDSSLD